MLECIVVGDSIAVRVHTVMPECAIYGKVGAGLNYMLDHHKGKSGKKRTIISLGSNDYLDKKFVEKLKIIRKSITSPEVVWIIPYNDTASKKVTSVARLNNDKMIFLSGVKTGDGVHPHFKQLSKKLKNEL